jgi:cell division septation protein DedD
MKTYFIVVSFLSCILIFLSACSSSEQTQDTKQNEKNTDSLYIFDEVPPEDLFEIESPTKQTFDLYVIQIGAFSSFDKAKDFADKSWTKFDKKIKVEFKENKNLYVVLIYPPFKDKESAIKYRSEIQKRGEFSDAWIVKIESEK